MRPLSLSARRLLAVTPCRPPPDDDLPTPVSAAVDLVVPFAVDGEAFATITEPKMMLVNAVASENTIAAITAVQPACLTDALAGIDRAGTDQVVAYQRASGTGRGP